MSAPFNLSTTARAASVPVSAVATLPADNIKASANPPSIRKNMGFLTIGIFATKYTIRPTSPEPVLNQMAASRSLRCRRRV
ncbi:protein of unknown function [Methylococcus capsulatus]|uniref:Uncharacterized protein n=1 Tax=Methylococcus capsulatus TaxID=414 RepID=A0AA35XZH3_METCP|nr:protein of unknown function [Methylococcus capsulatus]